MHDVTVIGAGPAGATAAILLRQGGREVALLDRVNFPRAAAAIGWLNARAAPLLAQLHVPVAPVLKHSFQDVVFHNADFTKTAKPRLANAPGFLINRAELDNALVKAAGDAGVHLLTGAAATRIGLKESSVQVELSDGKVEESRLLVIANGGGSPLPEMVGLARQAALPPIWSGQVDAEADASADPRVDVILGLDRRGSFGLCCRAGNRVSLTITWIGERKDAMSAFADLCASAHKHRLAPIDFSARSLAACWTVGTGSTALDKESHVAKHTLIIGDAGGFVSAASYEGLYPAMWSGQIAAEVLDAALRAPRSQDELMTFNSAWRIRMADYLRAPNTDIQFLLPMIFSNQPMADRMAAAFFSGENV